MYSITQLEVALDAAKTVIDSRAKSADRFIRGYNDCFAFLLEYERALRGDLSLSKDITLSYNDSDEFLQGIHEQLGYSNLIKFTLAMKFKPVKDRKPETGDIAFDIQQGIGGAMIAGDNYWFSADLRNKGVKPQRRFLPKEITLQLHARPIYLGE